MNVQIFGSTIKLVYLGSQLPQLGLPTDATGVLLVILLEQMVQFDESACESSDVLYELHLPCGFVKLCMFAKFMNFEVLFIS